MKIVFVLIGVIAYLLVGCVVAAITEAVTNPQGLEDEADWYGTESPKNVILLWPLEVIILILYCVAWPFNRPYEILMKRILEIRKGQK